MALIDDKDARILALLKRNSRMSIRELAGKAGLRPSTVHQRIEKLKEKGIIESFTIKLNDKLSGEGFTAFMLVSAKKDLNRAFFESPHIKEVFGITGEYDLLMKLKFANVEDFNRFLISARKNRALAKTLTMVSTIKLKEEI